MNQQYPNQPNQPQYQGPQQQVYQQAPQQQYQAPPQQPYQQNIYQTNVYQQAPPAAAGPLKTDRNFWLYLLLSFVTFGIYPIVLYCKFSTELNTIASRYDGKKTMNFIWAFLLGLVTFNIYPFVWMHMYCTRLGDELKRRGIAYSFSATDFWLWGVVGSIIFVGPFIFTAKLLKATNLVNSDYNTRG